MIVMLMMLNGSYVYWFKKQKPSLLENSCCVYAANESLSITVEHNIL